MNALGGLVVLPGGGFVEDQRGRLEGQGDGQGEALLLAERERQRRPLQDPLEAVERRPTEALGDQRLESCRGRGARFVGPKASSSRTVRANSIWLGLWKT